MIISIGYKNYLAAERIVAIVTPESRPIRNLIANARERNQLINATMGKRAKSVIIVNSNHVILSANLPDTIVERIHNAGLKAPAEK